MPLITESHDSLPYIDTDLTPQQRAPADALIAHELPTDSQGTTHPSLPDAPTPTFSPLIQTELDRRDANPDQPLPTGIDTSRYQALDPPPPASDPSDPAVLEQWRTTLRAAYASSTHIQTRLTNLSLLEQFGKNAWLVGNSQLEDVLRALERELAASREEAERLERGRRERQEGVRGEFEALDEAWRKGVGRVIETEVAAEGLRREGLERRRDAARAAVRGGS